MSIPPEHEHQGSGSAQEDTETALMVSTIHIW